MPEAPEPHVNPEGHVKVGTLDELREAECIPLIAGESSIAVFYHDDRVFALRNRCPHAGVALDDGNVERGILTCVSHRARFELATGRCLDPFTTDIDTFGVLVVDDEVWVDPNPQSKE